MSLADAAPKTKKRRPVFARSRVVPRQIENCRFSSFALVGLGLVESHVRTTEIHGPKEEDSRELKPDAGAWGNHDLSTMQEPE